MNINIQNIRASINKTKENKNENNKKHSKKNKMQKSTFEMDIKIKQRHKQSNYLIYNISVISRLTKWQNNYVYDGEALTINK